MGKLKNHVYPDLTLNEAIDLIRKINQVGGVISPTGLARMIGIDPRGGGLHQRIVDLKGYGLIEANGDLKITSLGKDILNGDTAKAWLAFVNVPLYAEMHQRLGPKEPPDNVALKHILYEITRGDDDEISRRVNRLKNNFIEALQYLQGAKAVGPVERPSEPAFQREPHRDSLEGSYLYLVDKKRKVNLGIDDSLDNLDMAIRHLQNVRNSLVHGAKQRTEKKPTALTVAE